MKSCCEDKSEALAVLRLEQGRILKIVLAINAVMFIVEFSAGWIAHSSALLSDSLDMLGDSLVYAFSLFVLSRPPAWRTGAALFKGIIMVAFGITVMIEVTSKLMADRIPAVQTMSIVAFVALIANLICLLLLLKHRNDDINMRSTYLCSRNDIIANAGVLAAALAVYLTSSKWPDIVIGAMIGLLFLKSAFSILRESILEFKKLRSKKLPVSA